MVAPCPGLIPPENANAAATPPSTLREITIPRASIRTPSASATIRLA